MSDSEQVTAAAAPRFAHESESQLAMIFDYYRIAWRYEPHTFPISWTLSGEVTECFTPDFYLPEIDLYIELTTLKQGLVRKKNRKLRHLRQLYPEIRIRLFYARDFKALMHKYGRVAAPSNGVSALTNGVFDAAEARGSTDGPGAAAAGGIGPPPATFEELEA